LNVESNISPPFFYVKISLLIHIVKAVHGKIFVQLDVISPMSGDVSRVPPENKLLVDDVKAVSDTIFIYVGFIFKPLLSPHGLPGFQLIRVDPQMS